MSMLASAFAMLGSYYPQANPSLQGKDIICMTIVTFPQVVSDGEGPNFTVYITSTRGLYYRSDPHG